MPPSRSSLKFTFGAAGALFVGDGGGKLTVDVSAIIAA
jgi:hypothetical protein